MSAQQLTWTRDGLNAWEAVVVPGHVTFAIMHINGRFCLYDGSHKLVSEHVAFETATLAGRALADKLLTEAAATKAVVDHPNLHRYLADPDDSCVLTLSVDDSGGWRGVVHPSDDPSDVVSEFVRHSIREVLDAIEIDCSYKGDPRELREASV